MAAPTALAATAVWEFRTAGNALNGGIFDAATASAGTDYSQQDAPQLAVTDAACTTGGAILTSATGGFTAAMIGNWCYLAGTNFTTGRRKIVGWTDGNTITLQEDPTNGSNASSGTCRVGGAIDLMTDTLWELATAGNTIHVKAGTYTLSGAISISAAGTGPLPIKVIGYNATRGDNPVGADRPLIAAAANGLSLGQYWSAANIRLTTTASAGLSMTTGGAFFNCKSYNSSTSESRVAISHGGSSTGRSVDCEAQSDYGKCFESAGTGILAFCYAHDATQGGGAREGINAAYNSVIVGCIADTCVVGIQIAASEAVTVKNCTIYACTTGIKATTARSGLFVNNIISGAAGTESGAVWTTNELNALWLYNDFYNNGTDRTLVTAGLGDFDADPGFVDAANGNFQTGAGVDNEGIGIRLGVG